MRMARVNITIPDELVARARAEGLNISAAAAQGLGAELERLDKIRALDDYLAELEEELGPIPPDEMARANAWADRVFGPIEDLRDSSSQ